MFFFSLSALDLLNFATSNTVQQASASSSEGECLCRVIATAGHGKTQNPVDPIGPVERQRRQPVTRLGLRGQLGQLETLTIKSPPRNLSRVNSNSLNASQFLRICVFQDRETQRLLAQEGHVLCALQATFVPTGTLRCGLRDRETGCKPELLGSY